MSPNQGHGLDASVEKDKNQNANRNPIALITALTHAPTRSSSDSHTSPCRTDQQLPHQCTQGDRPENWNSSSQMSTTKTMTEEHDPIDPGDLVRLERDGRAIAPEERWPGPHGPGTVIHTTDGGRFEFDHTDTSGSGEVVHVYRWVSDSP